MAVAAMLATGGAHAGNRVAADMSDLQPRMTYQTIAEVQSRRTSGYSGVGSIFAEHVSTQESGFGSVCTASLINATTAITAAHCVQNYFDGAFDPTVGVTFFLPSIGAALAGDPYEVFFATDFAFDTRFQTQGILSGYDVALFTLDHAAVGYDTYDLYYGDPLRDVTLVGTGTVGGPEGSDDLLTDYQKREGFNQYEFYGSDVFGSDSSRGVVLADFDDGTAEHDVFGNFLDKPGLGVEGEANSSPGDSGGPGFIDGKIATVTSFGITGAIFQGYCGDGYVDPYFDAGSCTNSSVGEIMGNTVVAYNDRFIQNFLRGGSGAVPEPAAWVMMILGFGMAGSALRRKRATARLAMA